MYNLQWASGDARLVGCHPSKALFFHRGCFITRGYRSRYRQAADGRGGWSEGWEQCFKRLPSFKILACRVFLHLGKPSFWIKTPFITDTLVKFPPILHCRSSYRTDVDVIRYVFGQWIPTGQHPMPDNFLKTSGCALIKAPLKTVLFDRSTSTLPEWPKKTGEELSFKRLYVAHFQESNVHFMLPTGWLRVGRLILSW